MDGRPETLIEEGCRARREGRLPEAQSHFADAVFLCRKGKGTGKDKALLAQALTGMGQIARDLHDGSRAFSCYEEAVCIHQGLDQPLRLVHTFRHVGEILRRMGRKVDSALSWTCRPAWLRAMPKLRAYLRMELAKAGFHSKLRADR